MRERKILTALGVRRRRWRRSHAGGRQDLELFKGARRGLSPPPPPPLYILEAIRSAHSLTHTNMYTYTLY